MRTLHSEPVSRERGRSDRGVGEEDGLLILQESEHICFKENQLWAQASGSMSLKDLVGQSVHGSQVSKLPSWPAK